MNRFLLAALILLLPGVCRADYILKGPHTTVETDGSQTDGSVNLITKNAGPIRFYTNNVERGSISATGIFTFLVAPSIANNTYLNWVAADGTSTLNVLKADATNNTVLNTASGTQITFSEDGVEKWAIFGSNDGFLQRANGPLVMPNAATAGAGLILGSSSTIPADVSALFQPELYTFSAVSASIRQQVMAHGQASAAGPTFVAMKSRAVDGSADTIVQAADELGSFSFYGADGAAFQPAAYIRGEVDSTPGSADMPGAIVFGTSADGAVSPLERLRIKTNGDILVNGTNGGDLILGKTGSALSVQEATAASACMGVSTPNGNTPVAVSTTCATSGARVFFTRVGAITNMGVITTTTAPSGTGFSYASTGASDTLASSVVYLIVKESA